VSDGRTLRLVLLPGDGIGREVVPAARRLLEALAADAGEEGPALDLVEAELGFATFERTGTALPDATFEAITSADGALLGAVGSPSHPTPSYRSPVVELRRRLDLYANLRPLRSIDGRIDILLVRENTEGLYAGRERRVDDDTAVAEHLVTRRATERITATAFEAARARRSERAQRGTEMPDRSRVTLVHKANVLRTSDGLFREVALEVASRYPDVAVEEQLVDAMAYHLVRTPERFDVVVASNLYGDILSDAGAALVGGLGLVPGANIGHRFCLAEPVHGSAPDIAGRGVANPLATVRAAALLLEYLGANEWARRLALAADGVLREGPRTPDLGGDATTVEMTAALAERLATATTMK
jgi:homoisocitrate dehydrogenase